jgi:hypothetical protein
MANRRRRRKVSILSMSPPARAAALEQAEGGNDHAAAGPLRYSSLTGGSMSSTDQPLTAPAVSPCTR